MRYKFEFTITKDILQREGLLFLEYEKSVNEHHFGSEIIKHIPWVQMVSHNPEEEKYSCDFFAVKITDWHDFVFDLLSLGDPRIRTAINKLTNQNL
jgi:hypothetical protein